MTTFTRRIAGAVPSRAYPTGCMACGAGKDDPCKLDKGDGMCPELNKPRGEKTVYGTGVSYYEGIPGDAVERCFTENHSIPFRLDLKASF